MAHHPRVLIQVACWNSAETLGECLTSLIEQSYQEWIAIVYDDGSSDSTRSVISQYAKLDHRITPYFAQTNKGVNVARNEILLKAQNMRWDVMTVLDSDDVAEPYFLADCVSLLDKGAMVVRCWNARYDKNLKQKKYEFLACAQVCLWREDVELLGGYRLKPFTADDDFMERLERLSVLKRGVVCHTARVVQRMRIHDTNLSKSKGSMERDEYEAKSRSLARKSYCISDLKVEEWRG